MPLPKWLARINKRVFNPREIRKGRRPVLTHVGRVSGRTYRTPLEAYPVESGYLFVAMYGSDSDWVKNALAAGGATLRIDGTEVELDSPRVLNDADAWRELPADVKPPPRFLNVTELVRMDVRA